MRVLSAVCTFCEPTVQMYTHTHTIQFSLNQSNESQNPNIFSPLRVTKPPGNASVASQVLLTLLPSRALSSPLIVGNQQHRYGRMFAVKWRLYLDRGNWVKGTQVNGAAVNNTTGAHNQLYVRPSVQLAAREKLLNCGQIFQRQRRTALSFCVRTALHVQQHVGRDGSVGIATGYGLNGQGFEFRWGKRFSVPVHTGLGSSSTVRTGGVS